MFDSRTKLLKLVKKLVWVWLLKKDQVSTSHKKALIYWTSYYSSRFQLHVSSSLLGRTKYRNWEVVQSRPIGPILS